MRILVVEDEETIADIIATKLRHEKYEVDISYNGEDGLYNANSNIYDLIILDIMLPKINGLDILKELKENIESKDKIIKDNDNKHTVTTFDDFITDWGNNVTKNKSYKIQNVKLNNITASLYIDYTYELNNETPTSTITFKHGNEVIYKHTAKSENFNISYLKTYDNFIIYGASKCDNVNNGICEQHFTYSQALAFNKDEFITFYDNTTIYQGDEIAFYNNTSLFLEDEKTYTNPYNDFRVYNIDIKNNNIYFDTIAEKYDVTFASDMLTYKNNCNSPYWITSTFDMQRSYSTKFDYNETYKTHEISNLQKISSIKYSDYCNNKNIIKFK